VEIRNVSQWREQLPAPPGNGDGRGAIDWILLDSDGNAIASNVVTSGQLPLPYGPYQVQLAGLGSGAYTFKAWVNGGNTNTIARERGDPSGETAVSNAVGQVFEVTIQDSNDGDNLPDWWEAHWFHLSSDPLGQVDGGDPDGDGLSNLQEYQLSAANTNLLTLNPANWDTDNDGMDDGWEAKYFSLDYNTGMNPCRTNATEDFDGDGLSEWQEYCGVDQIPPMQFDQFVDGVIKGKKNAGDHGDSLNPLDIDTDYDLLLDSFEAAWYDPANGIDPKVGVMSGIPQGTNVDLSIAEADPDHDGLTNYREQCLLKDLRQGSANENKWVWTDRVPFPQLTYVATDGTQVRICRMQYSSNSVTVGAPLNLGLVMNRPFSVSTNRFLLRNHEWTDPTDGTGYDYVDEDIPPGHDTDDDGLPDGWEVQFNLDPRDDGLTGGSWTNGPFGDPDDDGLMNIEEYLGQDGNRSTTLPYINGTGDETNPNEYNWRPDSTYRWRWYPANPLANPPLTDPRAGTGISRVETLGSAGPTASLGQDQGADSDDDGIPDALEMNPTNGAAISSPVHSCDPFIPRAALIVSSNGIPIPDPEPVAAKGPVPAGVRQDLSRRDWTIECQVKLLGTNLTGDIFNFQSKYGSFTKTVYRLSLSNNIPVLSADSQSGFLKTLTANALPTNQWIHIAGAWDHAKNSLTLYLYGGVLAMAKPNVNESFAQFMYPAVNTNIFALAVSPNGSFVNRLMIDEVRIWGVARTQQQIAQYANQLAPIANGDDVWINAESPQYYSHADTVIVNGGSLFAGEPGVPLSNVLFNAGNYWIDDGDGQYTSARDVLLARDSTLLEGLAGQAVANVFWNDKDGSGGFSRDSLLAYYRFDDGGATAEDFARRAKNSLKGAAREEFLFGDFGYALRTNNFLFVTNGAAPVYGVDQWGADDSDHDGLPDAWEIVNHLDPWDDGTSGESSPGAKDGPYGAQGDPDHDGLVNIYEYWSGTNPWSKDSDGNGVPDSLEDRDEDGVVNIVEQTLGSRPDMIDTDDDGLADNEEQGLGTSPASATDPAISRALLFGGAAGDYLDVPLSLKQMLPDWTLEAWIKPTNAVDGAGTIVRRVVQDVSGGRQAMNFVLGTRTNGAGGLTLYGGYVTADGTACLLTFGPLPAGQWTHVAASYDSLNAGLTLYTNGVAVGSTNTIFTSPPVNGTGGQTFVRIGEDFGGAIDEVRIWGKVRAAGDLSGNMNHVLANDDTNGLVSYFRFDDGETTTNLFPLGPYHQPGGLQDYTYPKDWNAQWRHAARRHGNVQIVTPGAIVPPPSLRVILDTLPRLPPDERLTGAQWGVDGEAWKNSGDTVEGLSPGKHTLMFNSVPGWTRPSSETIVLTNGMATTLTRLYVQQASVRITFDQPDILAAPAQWRVDGGAWQLSSNTVSGLDATNHLLSFSSVIGWSKPPDTTIPLSPGEHYDKIYEYAKVYGSVSAVILPPGAVSNGAQWRVDGGGWQASGGVVGGLALTTHTVEFSTNALWIRPGSIGVTLTNDTVATVTGVYSQVTGIYVDIQPPSAVATGAQWRLSGGDWTNTDVLVEVPAGKYTVQFSALGAGWFPPGDVSVTVVSQSVSMVVGQYFQADVFGGTPGVNPGSFCFPQGVAVDSLHRLYVADTFNDRIQRFDPLTSTWTAWGQYGTNGGGYFNKPGGVAVDAQGNVYVADSNNNRVQKRTATNGVWTVYGGFGTNMAKFKGPEDIAVDSFLNVYVADTDNDRVQRMSSNGVWSLLIGTGVATGLVTQPYRLSLDASNNLFVSDDGLSSGQSRIQEFGTGGVWRALLGSKAPAQGGFNWSGGTAIGSTNLYAADIGNSRIVMTPINGPAFAWQTLLGSNVVNGAQDVAWDPRGILYIADTQNHRIIAMQLPAGGVSNTVSMTAVSLAAATNGGFVVNWYGRLNWLYSVQYANGLLPPASWQELQGATDIPGRDAVTNATDRSVNGTTNRFYRVIGY